MHSLIIVFSYNSYSLIDSYITIKGVPTIQMDANEDIEIVKQQAYDKVVEKFPILLENAANNNNVQSLKS